MTKPMTAVAALMLYEEGRLQLDDPVAKYFPKIGMRGVAVMDDAGERVLRSVAPPRAMTILDLMRHTCGMPYGSSGSTILHRRYPHGSISAAAAMTGPEFLDRLSSAPLLHDPGKVWDYGFGLDVVGLIVERLTGQKLGQFLGARLFAPPAAPAHDLASHIFGISVLCDRRDNGMLCRLRTMMRYRKISAAVSCQLILRT
jgi:CubicO group peptidase (beta-lactamase class C family)